MTAAAALAATTKRSRSSEAGHEVADEGNIAVMRVLPIIIVIAVLAIAAFTFLRGRGRR